MRFVAVPLSLLALAAAAPIASAAEIVVFENDTSATPATETKQREQRLGFDADHTYDRALNGFAAELTPEQERALRNDPEVQAIVEDRPVRKQAAVTARPGGTIPPGIRRVLQAPANTVRQAATSAVAVLDTGVDLEHPDLNVVAGANCATTGPPDDADGHGTHVAGTVAAKDNGSGVVGVAPGTKIVAVKVLDDNGSGMTSTVLCGIEWVIANRATHDIEVANLSLGGAGDHSTCASDLEHNAYCRLAAAGVTTVVAAGNDGWDLGAAPPDVPASYPEVLTVSAMTDTDGVPGGLGSAPTCSAGDADDTFGSFSNFTTRVADVEHMVAAPGLCIRSTYPGGGTARMSGTSMASPHVAGLVALCHGEAGAEGPCSDLTPAQVIDLMVGASKDATGAGFTPDLANPDRLYGAFAVLPPAPVPLPAPEPEPAPVLQLEPAQPQAAPTPKPEATNPVPPPGEPIVDAAPAEPRPAPVRAPAPRLAISETTLTAFLTRGLGARVICAGACRATVRLTAVRPLKARGARLPAILARAATSTGTVVLRPTKATRRALKRAKRLSVVVQADVSTPGGTVRLRRTIALR